MPTTAAALPWTTAVSRDALRTLQLNIGRFCNLACTHCHVESSPKRHEHMSAETLDKVLAWIDQHRPPVVDITGGAPELNPGFREIVRFARERNLEVMDRCNLAVIDEAGQEDLVDFLAEYQVHVVASMPCYLVDNVDKQRGKGTYDRSVAGLRALNAAGYGRRPELPLHLIYNPGGASLPPAVAALEAAYRERLATDWGIVFDGLWCLANVPIKRFRRFLEATGKLESYEQLLFDNYNPATLQSLMCRSTLSVDHDGRIYDCDFNLAIELDAGGKEWPRYLWEVSPEDLAGDSIAMDRHCLACTAGCGSSCTGAVV
ncbi:MAG: radical SAM/Cys-rich domain protein [Planctomycetota bacterium]|nr:MAG: radical SAM/Cys-rich domain protein [Planctomycetota bacterium]